MSLPPLLSEWAAQRGIELQPRASDGRVALTIDERYRVYLFPAPENRLLMEARVRDLPSDALARDRLVADALQASTARIRQDASRLAVDEGAAALLLQQDARTDGGMEAFNGALTAFINSLAAWRLQLQR